MIHLSVKRKTRTFAKNYPSEKVQDSYHLILGLRGHRYFVVVDFGQPFLPVKLLLYRMQPWHRACIVGCRMEVCKGTDTVLCRRIYACFPWLDLQGEHADRRILVLSFLWVFRGWGAALRHRQDFRSAIVWPRVVWLCLLDSHDP